MSKKIIGLFSTVALAAVSFLVFNGALAAPRAEPIPATIEIIGDGEFNPGDQVEVRVTLFDPAATADQAGSYGFLLEVAGLKPTGKLQSQFTQAGPEKVVFVEDANGLKWQGDVAEGGQIRLRAQYIVDYCQESNGEDCTGIAELKIKQPGDEESSVNATVSIKDNGQFDHSLVQLKAAILSADDPRPEDVDDFDDLPLEGACMVDCQNVLIGIKNGNEDAAQVFIHITAHSSIKMRPNANGIKMRPLFEDKEAGTITYGIRVLVGDDLKTLNLTAQIDGILDDDAQLPIEISYCTTIEGASPCDPSAGAEDGRMPIITLLLIWRMRDLSDAPTSYNNAGLVMETYPGHFVNPIARFPVSRNPAVVVPAFGAKGPAHRLSNLFHLGASVTPEYDVDRYWDSDGQNNIEPSIGPDQFDFDGADDGIDISTISFTDCGSTDIPVEVTITPEIITWFQNEDDDGLAYINIWLDSNRDGQWGHDNLTLCNFGNSVSEHIVIDAVVDPVSLGVGTHTITVNAPMVGWTDISNGDFLEVPAWMRVMLSPIESNKDLYISFGDGRGEEFVYFGGETEDYYYVAPDVVAAADSEYTADMSLDVRLTQPGTHAKASDQAFPGVSEVDGEMVIRFRNDGYKTAEEIEIVAELPESLISFGNFSLLNCAGCEKEVDIKEGVGTFKVDKLDPGEFGKLSLGWTGCLTCIDRINDSFAQAKISIKSKEDFRPENNVRFYDGWPLKSRLTPQVTLGWNGCLTCTRAVEDVEVIPDAYNFLFETHDPDVTHFRMYQDGEQVGDDNEMCDGIPCEDLGFILGDGVNMGSTTFTYIDKSGNESPASKPIELSCTNDIVRGSLVFINEDTNKQRRIPAEAYDDLDGLFIPVKTGGNYKAVVMYCGDDESPDLSLQVGSQSYQFEPVSLGSSVYEIFIVVEAERRGAFASSIVMSVESNGTTYEDTFTADEAATGMVQDAATGSAVSGAEILILTEQTTEFGGETVSVMAPWDGTATGHSNPVNVSDDGGYAIEVPDGTYQIVVIADGYQSYRSSIMEVADGQIASTVNLIEARPAPSNINIGVDETGFDQSFVQVEAGWVVKFVNTGSSLHGAASEEIGESSGLMAPGEGFKMAFETAGTFTIVDPANANNSIIVQVTGTSSGVTIFLPVIQR